MSSFTRSPTHAEVPSTTTAKLALALEDASDNGGSSLAHGDLLAVARESGERISHCYAASLLADVKLSEASPVQLVFCVGACQRWGALDCIDHAAERLHELTAKGRPHFDIRVRQCLERCEKAAVCEVRTPEGTQVLTETDASKLDGVLGIF